MSSGDPPIGYKPAVRIRHGGPATGFRHAISDADRVRVRDLLPAPPGPRGGVAEDIRRFLDAVL